MDVELWMHILGSLKVVQTYNLTNICLAAR